MTIASPPLSPEGSARGDVVRLTSDATRLRVAFAGPWTAETVSLREADADRLAQQEVSGCVVTLDASGVTRLDTLGGALIARIEADFVRRGARVERAGFSPTAERLYGNVVARLAVPPPQPYRGRSRAEIMVRKIGRETVGAGQDVVALLSFLGEVIGALMRVVTLKGRFRLAAIVNQLDHVALRATPIILLITFLIGAIIAQQGIFHFRRFGADSFVVEMVGILTLREIGVLIVSIMVAGRTGSAFTAEIGSMKMREEIDALRVMGLNPVDVLVLPRVVALVIGLPLLTILGNLSALMGGAIVAQLYGNIPFEIFFGRLQEEVSARHIWVGLTKAPFMALVIGLIACIEGLRVKGSAESLGAQTTQSVVKAIFLVIVLDGVFAMFFAAIGY